MFTNQLHISILSRFFVEGGNKNPLKRKAFRDVDQVKLEEALEKYCKHVGIQAAFDLKSYANMNTPEAVDITGLAKLMPLILTLVGSTAT